MNQQNQMKIIDAALIPSLVSFILQMYIYFLKMYRLLDY